MIMPASWNQNRLTAKLGIEHAIEQPADVKIDEIVVRPTAQDL
jgi:NADP-dependent 3-hydroxy acid dehydrogenase YdfG